MTGTTVQEVIKKEHFDIAVKKVSIGNSITSIKKIQRINFLEIFERINGVEEVLKQDPVNVYSKMDNANKYIEIHIIFLFLYRITDICKLYRWINKN